MGSRNLTNWILAWEMGTDSCTLLRGAVQPFSLHKRSFPCFCTKCLLGRIPNEISHEISNVKFHEISLVKFSSCCSEISKFCCVEEIGSGRRLFVLDATSFFGGIAFSLSLSLSACSLVSSLQWNPIQSTITSLRVSYGKSLRTWMMERRFSVSSALLMMRGSPFAMQQKSPRDSAGDHAKAAQWYPLGFQSSPCWVTAEEQASDWERFNWLLPCTVCRRQTALRFVVIYRRGPALPKTRNIYSYIYRLVYRYCLKHF